MATELSDNDRALLAREVAADGHEPVVADVSDVLRVPRDSFIAGWDAAVAYLRERSDSGEVESSEALGIEVVLGKPTRWREFVETLNVERF